MMMTLTNYWIACLFYVFTMIIGIYIFLNLFLAILLNNLDQLEFDEPASGSVEASTLGSLADSLGAHLQRILMIDKMRWEGGRGDGRHHGGPHLQGILMIL